MTSRERLALVLVLLGGVALIVTAAAYGGWRAALATAGVLMLGCGILLGLDDGVAPAVPVVVSDPDTEPSP